MFLYLLALNFQKYNIVTIKSRSTTQPQSNSNENIDLDRDSEDLFTYLESQKKEVILCGKIKFGQYLFSNANYMKSKDSSGMMEVQTAAGEQSFKNHYDYMISNGFKFFNESKERFFLYLCDFYPSINT